MSCNEINNSVIFDENHFRGYQGKNTKINVTFVLGKFAGKEVKSLLVARFYRQYSKCPSPAEVHTLFNSVMKITKNHGIERNRFGVAVGIFNENPSEYVGLSFTRIVGTKEEVQNNCCSKSDQFPSDLHLGGRLAQKMEILCSEEGGVN